MTTELESRLRWDCMGRDAGQRGRSMMGTDDWSLDDLWKFHGRRIVVLGRTNDDFRAFKSIP